MSQHRGPHLRRVIPVILVAALAACSGSESDPGASPRTTTSAPAEPTRDTHPCAWPTRADRSIDNIAYPDTAATYWGQGYATEAMRALFAFGFNELALHRVADAVDPANVASLRVLEKLGLRREGHLRAARWYKGRWCDEYLYAILAAEWQTGQQGEASG